MRTYPMKAAIRAEGGSTGGSTRIDIFDDIGAGFFTDGVTPASFTAQLAGVTGPLDVHVNSAGGDVFDGLAIAEAIRSHAGPVTVTVDGLAASVASVIVQAGAQRVMAPGSMLMIHDAWGFPEEPNEAGLLKMAATLGKVSNNLAEQYAARAGFTPEFWRQAMRDETWYTADEAVMAGLADRVGSVRAVLPAGVDLAALAVPGRIAAALRSMPRAAGSHPPFTGTHFHGHSAYGDGSGDDDGMHSHPHEHHGDADHGHGHGAPAQDSARPHGEAGHPYEPAPYHRDPDENVECPKCHLFNDSDARFCDQCGARLIGRDDVRVLPPQARAASRPRGAADDEELGDGWVRGPDGRIRFDPDGDGDDDSTPEGDADHDYWSADGTQVRPIPPCPVGRGQQAALSEERVRAILRQEVARAAAGSVDHSAWDADKAWHNGATSDDPATFYAGICAGEKTTGEPANQDHWALPYRYTPDSAPNAAAVRNCLARLNQVQDLKDPEGTRKKLQGLMKAINPDYEPENRVRISLSGVDLERLARDLKEAMQ